MNPADLSWPEDPGYRIAPPVPPLSPEEIEYRTAMAELALAGARRNRYGMLPGRDPALVEQLNAETEAAQVRCDAAREALITAREG